MSRVWDLCAIVFLISAIVFGITNWNVHSATSDFESIVILGLTLLISKEV